MTMIPLPSHRAVAAAAARAARPGGLVAAAVVVLVLVIAQPVGLYVGSVASGHAAAVDWPTVAALAAGIALVVLVVALLWLTAHVLITPARSQGATTSTAPTSPTPPPASQKAVNAQMRIPGKTVRVGVHVARDGKGKGYTDDDQGADRPVWAVVPDLRWAIAGLERELLRFAEIYPAAVATATRPTAPELRDAMAALVEVHDDLDTLRALVAGLDADGTLRGAA